MSGEMFLSLLKKSFRWGMFYPLCFLIACGRLGFEVNPAVYDDDPHSDATDSATDDPEDRETDVDSDAGADMDTKTDAYGDTDIDADADADTNSDTTTDSDTGTDQGVDSDSDTETETESDFPCGGIRIGGFCWYLGRAGETCTEACSANGGYHEATRTYAGSDGTAENCQAVLNGMGYSGIVVDWPNTEVATGCHVWKKTTLYRNLDPTTDAEADDPHHERACACNN